MAKSNLPNSIRKFLRREKARLRREFSNTEEAEKRIKEVVEKMFKGYNKRSSLKVLRKINF